MDYYNKNRGGIIDWQRDGQFLREQGYFTTQIGDEAVRLIEKQDTSRPMFLYVASLAAHTPLQAPQATVDAYKPVFANEEKRAYAAMITELDTQIGRIVSALEKKGMRNNTLIFFTTDNGGLRNMKVQAPGGHAAAELPAFVNWPGRLRPGVVNEPLHHVDVMPTLLAIAGGQGSPDHPFDGRNAWATLAEGKPAPHEDILINAEIYRGAVRKGKWKLVKVALLPGKTELFDLSTDPGEKNNVADQFPEVVRDLEARLTAYAKQQKMSEWLKAQPSFMGPQGKTLFDAGYDLDDGGLPQEKPLLPVN